MLRRVLAIAALVVMASTPASAHSAARGFVLLLPTTHVIVAGALAVLASFAAVSLLPDRLFRHRATSAVTAGDRPGLWLRPTSLVSAAILVLLLWTGFAGPHDPLENLLTLTVWTLWWVVIVLLHPVVGNLWGAINPFAWASPAAPRCRITDGLSYVPALLIFAPFAWFQLVYPAPEDPERLALVVGAYAGLTLVAVVVFGANAWLRIADPFAIFLRQLGAAAPVAVSKNGLELQVPGAGLLRLPPLPLAGVAFVLLTLSAISFDGLSHTFLWLSSLGFNPLEYPGRTALVAHNSVGLAATFLVLAAVYAGSIAAGWLWAGRPASLTHLLGRFIYSLIPISIAYHFAHYLSDGLLNLQYLVLALNDPFGSGAQLLGLEPFHVTASFQNTASGAMALFTAQTAAIVVGHIIGVGVAHAMALDFGLSRAAVLKLEAPLALLMVLYTGFGLWLLATPTAS